MVLEIVLLRPKFFFIDRNRVEQTSIELLLFTLFSLHRNLTLIYIVIWHSGTGRVYHILVHGVKALLVFRYRQSISDETHCFQRFYIGSCVNDILFYSNWLMMLEPHNTAFSSLCETVVLDFCGDRLRSAIKLIVSSKSACFGNLWHVDQGRSRCLRDRSHRALL